MSLGRSIGFVAIGASWLLLASATAFAQVGQRGVAAPIALLLTLEEVLESAVTRPQAKAADLRATAAEQDAETVRRQTLWPSIRFDAALNRRDRDYNFDTPLGGLILGERTSSVATLSLVQPILDPAQRFHQLPAAQREAVAAHLDAERLRQRLIAEAADRFLDILANDARLRSSETFIESLEARLQETALRVAAGRALEADALKVKLDFKSAVLERSTLKMTRGVLVRELGRVVGHRGAVEPKFDGPYDHELRTPVADLIRAAQERRPDVLALDAQRQARQQRAAAERATRWPRLEAGANWFVSDGDPLRPEELVEGSLRVSWTPFRSKTRQSRSVALKARADALELELEELRRSIAIEIHTAVAQLEQSRAVVKVRQSGIELAGETLRVERERASSGRATTNDLLDAEAALHRQRTEHALTQIEVLRAWIGLSLATGDDALRQGLGSAEEERE